eukprot:GHVH01004810.1.p1 GENE.GHVH01004810.1~~GHVH01004810.1.p1  ORF type:complete len:380 (-),score=38.63 GHVH01004810.1:52-1191(-)
MFSLFVAIATAAPHQQSYGKDHAVSASPPEYSCQPGYFLDGKACVQEFTESVVKSCPIGFVNSGTEKEVKCSQTAEKIANCPFGSVAVGNVCSVTDTVPAIPFCPPGYTESGKGCKQVVDLPVVQKCDVGKMVGKECLLEDRVPLMDESYCPPGYNQTANGCQKTTTYDCTEPAQSKIAGVGSQGQHYSTQHSGNTGRYYATNKKLRMLKPKKSKKHTSEIVDYGKAVLPPPVMTVVSKQCERVEFSAAVTTSFCPPGYDESGNGCVKLIKSEPRTVCSNGASSKDCRIEKFAALQRECPKGYNLEGMTCSASRTVDMEYDCPTGFYASGKGCERTAKTIANCPPSLVMNNNQCIGKRFSEPIVTQRMTCIGKGCENNR